MMVRQSFENPYNSLGFPEIVKVFYDLANLEITLEFENSPRSLEVVFDRPRGFLALDELDLIEFWAPENRPDGWIWVIESGGWKDQEIKKPTSLMEYATTLTEYMILGVDVCVNVLSDTPPKLVMN